MKVKRKVILTPEYINEIVSLYQTTKISVHQLGEKFKVGHKKISQIIKNSGVKMNIRGGQLKSAEGVTKGIVNAKTLVYESLDSNKEYVAVCKLTGTVLKDPNNYSGILTNHILKTFGDVPVPTNTYQRKKYELANGKKWFEEYFDIVEVEKSITIGCKLCNWNTDDVKNNTGALTKHINLVHNLESSEYIQQFPDQSFLWDVEITMNNKLSDLKQSVLCLECNKRFLGLTETHMNNIHQMSLSDYKNKWGDVDIFSSKTSEFLSAQTIEMNKTLENKFTSKAHVEISDFIKSFGVEVILNNKSYLKGTEIDILIPEKKLGIEYNGLYWHSENSGKKSKLYHINKTKLAADNGIKLIQIFEDEWRFKKDIVLSRIKNMIGVSDRKLYARNCEIKEINTQLKDVFLIKTHIQGIDKSSVRLGAYIKDELVGIMTFSKPRKSTGFNNSVEGQYEMVRFSSLGVTGLASKLLRYFISNYNPSKITTFADRRWTPIHENCMYEKLNFNFVSETKPNYWYTKTYARREHRFNFRKDILVKEGFDANLSEFEIMQLKGYDKVWDCGSFKYEMVFG